MRNPESPRVLCLLLRYLDTRAILSSFSLYIPEYQDWKQFPSIFAILPRRLTSYAISISASLRSLQNTPQTLFVQHTMSRKLIHVGVIGAGEVAQVIHLPSFNF